MIIHSFIQSNGFAQLKQSEKLSHSFNVKEIRCIEAKSSWGTQDMEALENNGKSSIFEGIHKPSHQQKEKEKRKPQKVK